ncbi:MAG: hypothetical protein ACKOWG_02235, partial [Planctomycetia bacterium]
MRIPVAEPRESEVSRRQARLEALAGDRVRLTNLSTAIAIRCFGRADLETHRQRMIHAAARRDIGPTETADGDGRAEVREPHTVAGQRFQPGLPSRHLA